MIATTHIYCKDAAKNPSQFPQPECESHTIIIKQSSEYFSGTECRLAAQRKKRFLSEHSKRFFPLNPWSNTYQLQEQGDKKKKLYLSALELLPIEENCLPD